MSLNEKISDIEGRLLSLGKTDFHNGKQTIENRLEIIEGSISILCSGHKNFVNSDDDCFWANHEHLHQKYSQEISQPVSITGRIVMYAIRLADLFDEVMTSDEPCQEEHDITKWAISFLGNKLGCIVYDP